MCHAPKFRPCCLSWPGTMAHSCSFELQCHRQLEVRDVWQLQWTAAGCGVILASTQRRGTEQLSSYEKTALMMCCRFTVHTQLSGSLVPVMVVMMAAQLLLWLLLLQCHMPLLVQPAEPGNPWSRTGLHRRRLVVDQRRCTGDRRRLVGCCMRLAGFWFFFGRQRPG